MLQPQSRILLEHASRLMGVLSVYTYIRPRHIPPQWFVLQQLLQHFLVGDPMDVGRNLACLGCHAPHKHVLDGYRALTEAMGLESLTKPSQSFSIGRPGWLRQK
jgi:hypothetical protein